MEIWKWQLSPDSRTVNEIDMPKGAQILDVQTQTGIPCIWALVDPSQPKQSRSIWVFGTGHKISEGQLKKLDYIGTYQTDIGAYVFHVFEEVRR